MCILTSKRALRHNSVDFLNISTAKSALNGVCFVHFDFEVCFMPQQQRALFRHRNFQKCSERAVLLAFSLANVLRATTACNLSFLVSPDGSAPAALASLLFDPPEPQIMRLFYPSPHLHLLSSDSFSFLIFSLLLFSSLTLPTSAFPSVHVVGSLTSELPSRIIYQTYLFPSLYIHCLSITLW